MKNSVSIIAHPTTGEMFTATSDPNWVKCQLHSEEVVVSNGVITVQPRTCFPLLSSKVADLFKNLKSGNKFPIEGKILRRVTLQPQFENHAPVINPKSGEIMGYYSTYYFSTLASETDYDERVLATVAVETPAEQIPADQVV